MRVRFAQRQVRLGPCPVEGALPLAFVDLAVLVVPERLEHVAVLEEEAEGPREPGPDEIVQEVLAVELHEPLEEAIEHGLLRRRLALDLVGVGGVEGDPEKDEAGVVVAVAPFGAAQPAHGSVHAQGDAGMPGLDAASAGFQAGVVETHPALRAGDRGDTITGGGGGGGPAGRVSR